MPSKKVLKPLKTPELHTFLEGMDGALGKPASFFAPRDLSGADVTGGLVQSNVLLSGLQGQTIGGVPKASAEICCGGVGDEEPNTGSLCFWGVFCFLK